MSVRHGSYGKDPEDLLQETAVPAVEINKALHEALDMVLDREAAALETIAELKGLLGELRACCEVPRYLTAGETEIYAAIPIPLFERLDAEVDEGDRSGT